MGRVKQALSLMVGAVADAAMPGLGRDMEAGRNRTHAAGLKRAILKSRVRRAQASKDTDRVQEALAAFWLGASGDQFHAEWGRASFEHFRDNHSGLIDVLDNFVRTSGLGFSRIVEVGCGAGDALAYCAEQLPWVVQGVGIDINAGAIDRANGAQPPGSRLSFVCTDPADWLAAHPQAGTVMLSNGGVLEYFSQEGVDRLLAALALRRPAAVLLVEPLDGGHDLGRQLDSYTFNSVGAAGAEITFSHNHRARLQHAGFEVVFAEETRLLEVRGMMMLAVLR
jgi:SAM-dependent methyltransferase